jgi:hypothetical protein
MPHTDDYLAGHFATRVRSVLRKISALLVIPIVVTGITTVGFTTAAHAVGANPNSLIAADAMKAYQGGSYTWPNNLHTPNGQCIDFAEAMVDQAEAIAIPGTGVYGGSYYAPYAAAGGQLVPSWQQAQPGDIIQLSPSPTSWSGDGPQHTAIVYTAPSSGSNWTVVDSNFNLGSGPLKLNNHPGMDVINWAVKYNLMIAVWRFGTVGWTGVGSAAQSLGADHLNTGQVIHPNQYLVSQNVLSTLILQTDGDLAEYSLGKRVWDSGTTGQAVASGAMQSDGNFVLYAPDGKTAVWSTKTNGTLGNYSLDLQNDGNLALYATGNPNPLWTPSTWNPPPWTSLSYLGGNRLDSDCFWGICAPLPGYIQLNQYLRSTNGEYALLLQDDGNLVEYGPGYHVLWNSKTNGKGVTFGEMQSDGNFVLYRNDWTPEFDTKSSNTAAVQLMVQDDGNVVVYNSAGTQSFWNSGTSGQI